MQVSVCLYYAQRRWQQRFKLYGDNGVTRIWSEEAQKLTKMI